MKNTFFFLISFIAFAGCNAQQDLIDLGYGKHKQQTLDLLLPEKYTDNTPVVIMVHGGGWMMGGKEYTDKRGRDLRSRGFVVANIDYRYVSETVHCKDLLEDIDNAVAYVLKEGGKYGYNTEQFHLAGISAGAHLSLMYGYTTSKKVRSINAICPPILFDSNAPFGSLDDPLMKNIELLADAKYMNKHNQSEEFRDISPAHHIKDIPTLLVHGDNDRLVPCWHSGFLYSKLEEKKIDSKLLIMKGKDHDAGLNDPNTEKEVYDTLTDWINTHN
jgi:acetyl esterase/lipase